MKNTSLTTVCTKLLEERNKKKDVMILQLNSWKSELLPELDALGYVNLYGIDQNRNVYDMPGYTHIRYQYGKGVRTHFPDDFFDLVIISRGDSLGCENTDQIEEASRILRPGGLLIMHTKNTKIAEGLKRILNNNKFRFVKSYQNAFIFEQAETKVKLLRPKHVAIVNYLGGGMVVYCNEIAKRMKKEYGIDSIVVNDVKKIPRKVTHVIIDHERGILDRDNILKHDISFLLSSGKKVFVEIHTILGLKNDPQDLRNLLSKTTLLYRLQEFAEMDKMTSYYLMPHISYKTMPLTPSKRVELCVGTFGFTSPNKNIDEIIAFTKHENIRGNILLSKESEEEVKHDALISKLSEKNSSLVHVHKTDGRMSTISQNMEMCSHILFAHASTYCISGTMKLAKRFNRPIIAIDTLMSKEAQVIRVMKFTNSFTFFLRFVYNELRSEAYYYYHSRNFTLTAISVSIKQLIIRFAKFIISKPLTRKQLKMITDRKTRDEDGLPYLVKVISTTKNT